MIILVFILDIDVITGCDFLLFFYFIKDKYYHATSINDNV